MARVAERLVGRVGEIASLGRLLDDLDGGRPAAVAVAGEPGIGKTRLLEEVATRAEARGHTVLSGSASELEHDLPFAVFADALDEYLAGLEPRQLAALGDHRRGELAHIFPSLRAPGSDQHGALQYERYRSHRAVRDLLELLASSTPLILVLDDVHWADPASVELIGSLLRRPPGKAVLMALAVRPRQMPERLLAPLERAHRAGSLTRIEVGALSPVEARAFLGEAFGPADAAALYEECGGNPFYLEQVARAIERRAGDAPVTAQWTATIEVPSAVAAALAEELGLLSDSARLLLEGAAVAGDPFEPELAAAAARTSEESAMDAIDELLNLDIIRETDAPRRFRFRHPLVRRAVYESAPGGWRLSAHSRCAEALAGRGANAVARAHHVERSARQGDLAAAAVLREAGQAAGPLAPGSAARWFGGALRLLPDLTPAEDRVELLLAQAGALAATGQFVDSHKALLDAVAIVPEGAIALRTRVTTECAGMEHRLGRYSEAHKRLVSTLDSLPQEASAESVALLIALALNEFYRSKYQSMHHWAERAVSGASVIEDAPLVAAASVMPALAHTMTGQAENAQAYRATAAALVDSLSDQQLALRIDAAAWLASAEAYLDRYAEADAHATRALNLSRATGQRELFLVLYQILGRVWYVRGHLAQATELLDGAIEAARLSANTQALVGHLFNRSAVALAVGDLDIALTAAQESVNLARELDEGFVAVWAAVRLAAVLLETRDPIRAIELLLGSAGGDGLTLIPGGWRAYCLDLLTRCWLALGRGQEAERAADLAGATAVSVRLPLAEAWADRAAAAVALHAGDRTRAVERALRSASAADKTGAPMEAGLSLVLAGRALAEAGQDDRAVAELQRAAAIFDVCGALRFRQSAERELGKLGHRPHRRTRPGDMRGSGIEPLTERELQVARLVVDRRTNSQIAAELFLSQKTVETHLRNIFNKMRVSTRVALARAVEQMDRKQPHM